MGWPQRAQPARRQRIDQAISSSPLVESRLCPPSCLQQVSHGCLSPSYSDSTNAAWQMRQAIRLVKHKDRLDPALTICPAWWQEQNLPSHARGQATPS